MIVETGTTTRRPGLTPAQRTLLEKRLRGQTTPEASPHHLSEIDLSLQPAERRENYLRQLLELEAGRPFDLARDELFRTLLISVDVNDHVLFLNQHHIISDAWSLGVFFREL